MWCLDPFFLGRLVEVRARERGEEYEDGDEFDEPDAIAAAVEWLTKVDQQVA